MFLIKKIMNIFNMKAEAPKSAWTVQPRTCRTVAASM
jgi:hypothetical protein